MKALETTICYTFKDSSLLQEALTHPSLAYETKRKHKDNQRLEFLGDAVLQLVLTEYIYMMFPDYNEGTLTKFRSQLVSKNGLCQFARKIELGEFLMLGKGEEASGGRERASTLADALEALFGAIYIDGGIEEAKRVILGITADDVTRISSCPNEKNPKGELQELLQAIIPESPVYKVEGESGPGHNKTFSVLVEWRGETLAQGTGPSKKEAEAQAAAHALENKRWLEISE